MKRKKFLVFILVAMTVLATVACSGANEDADLPDESTDSTDVSVSDSNNNNDDTSTIPEEPSDSTKLYDYEDKGEIFFNYPESYSYSDDTGMLTFTNPDESLNIMVRATVNNTNDLETTTEYYESYNTFEEFSQEEITIAGYDALRISYLDDWGDHKMNTLIKFGDDADLFNGIRFEASSSAGKELLSDPKLKEMIESIRLAE